MKQATNITRLAPVYWGFVVFFLGVAGIYLGAGILLYLRDRELPLLLMTAFVALLLTAIVSPTIYELVVVRIAWDGTGIWYRTYRGNQFIPWQEIADYGLRHPAKSRSRDHATYLLVLQNGKKIRFMGRWKNSDAFREAVITQATDAQAHAWELMGGRRIDMPTKTFRYSSISATFGAIISATIAIFSIGYILVRGISSVAEIFSLVGVIWGIVCLIGLGVFCMIPLLLGWCYFVLFYEIARRGNERIDITPNGISFSNHGQTRTFPWSVVVDYYADGKGKRHYYKRYVVQFAGDREEVIRFESGMKGVEILKEIIAHHAPAPLGETWRYVGSELDTKSKSVGSWWGSDSKTRTYDYRTPISRVFIFIFTMLPVTDSAFLLRNFLHDTTPSPIEWGISGAFVLLLTYIWWHYFATRLVTSDHGISLYTPFAVRRLRWAEVTEWRVEKKDAFYVTTLQGPGKQRIRAWSLLEDYENLNDAIEQRTGLAAQQREDKKGARLEG